MRPHVAEERTFRLAAEGQLVTPEPTFGRMISSTNSRRSASSAQVRRSQVREPN